ncbi:MAG: hypothetical protein KBT68_12255 [bacterium]|nr:hypothetical protein [Candidatus Colisoma equi]
MKKLIVIGCAAVAWMRLSADDSVIGYWRFNDPDNYGKDSSGRGNDLPAFGFAYGAQGAPESNWARGGGYLELPRSSSTPYTYGKVTAALTSGRGLDMSRKSPGWTIGAWVRGSSALASSIKNAQYATSGDAKRFKDALADGKWHPMVVAFRPNDSEKNYYHIFLDAFYPSTVCDITAGGTDSLGKPSWYLPLSIDDSSVTLGGSIGGKYSFFTIDADFFGGLDDCIILDRELKGGSSGSDANSEVFRWVQTGETYVYSVRSDTSSSGTCSLEASHAWSSLHAPETGLDYIVENGYVIRTPTNENYVTEFAGASLTLGRTKVLKGILSVDGSEEVVVSNTMGLLTQYGANTTVKIGNLVLNDGTLNARQPGQKLQDCAITVNANERGSNFVIQVETSADYTVTGSMVGDGTILKTGNGRLDLSALTESTASVSLARGTLRLAAVNPVLASYENNLGILLIGFDESKGTAETVTVESDWSGQLKFKMDGQPSVPGRYPVLSVAKSVKTVTQDDLVDGTTFKSGSGLAGRVKVVDSGAVQTVYAEYLPKADQAGSPVLILE